jgi:hypothetical protein
MAKVTISELLGVQQQVKTRYNELVQLRNQNSNIETHYRGQNADKSIDRKPTYSVVKLDKLIARLARELRLIDAALKKTNASTIVDGYDWEDVVLGEIEAAEATA